LPDQNAIGFADVNDVGLELPDQITKTPRTGAAPIHAFDVQPRAVADG
jgi:hypothetical protein